MIHHSAYPWAVITRRRMTLAILILLTLLAVAWGWGGLEIASPARRPLQAHHLEFLQNPAAHGVRLSRFQLSDQTPCLMIEPATDGTKGRRGLTVREQLKNQSVPLSEPGTILGTLVLLHGRNGRKEDYLLVGERLCAAGFRCLLPDLPAHGEHPGKVATFGIQEAAMPALLLREAAEKFGFSPQPAGLLGMSMGGAVAIHAAAREAAPWRTLVVISSFDRLDTTLKNNVSRKAGAWLGAAWLAGAEQVYRLRTGIQMAEIRSDRPASTLDLPVLICHGTADRVIPLASGQRLYAALKPAVEKRWIEVPGADHHNVLITDFPLYATLARWLLEHMGKKP